MKKIIWILTLATTSGSTSFGQHLNVIKLDSFFNILATKGLAMGSLAISKNGVIQYKKAIGYSYISTDKKILADTGTKYRIGSATKMFTAVMIFQLIEEGKIRLGQKLAIFFPELPNSDKITIQEMLYHRSGLHDYTHDTDFPSWMDKPKSHEELLKIIKEKGSDFAPGTKADYCNTNFLLLGYIIEKICQMSYADALKERITAKLNLKNTYFGKPIDTADHESASYKYSGNSWIKQKQTDLTIHGGAGSIVSTPSDMVTFINALFSGKLILKADLVKMETTIDDYGMGMFPNKYGDKHSFGHNGRIEEFYSALWYFPGEKLSFAYCTNGIDFPRTDILEGMLKICFNEPFSIPFTRDTVARSEELDKYLGQYASEQIAVNCTKDANKLLLETKGKVFEVQKISRNYFMNAENGFYFEFFPSKGELQIKETENIYYLKRH
jgi:D-alanyl-D-alanine carboxypeptidase